MPDSKNTIRVRFRDVELPSGAKFNPITDGGICATCGLENKWRILCTCGNTRKRKAGSSVDDALAALM